MRSVIMREPLACVFCITEGAHSVCVCSVIMREPIVCMFCINEGDLSVCVLYY